MTLHKVDISIDSEGVVRVWERSSAKCIVDGVEMARLSPKVIVSREDWHDTIEEARSEAANRIVEIGATILSQAARVREGRA